MGSPVDGEPSGTWARQNVTGTDVARFPSRLERFQLHVGSCWPPGRPWPGRCPCR